MDDRNLLKANITSNQAILKVYKNKKNNLPKFLFQMKSNEWTNSQENRTGENMIADPFSSNQK